MNASERRARRRVDSTKAQATRSNVYPFNAHATYVHLPVTVATKLLQVAEVRDIVAEQNVDLVVFAHYTQVLSPSLCEYLNGRAINIHHSFLPSFDKGPIIEQDVARVNHSMSAKALTVACSDLECTALARAVKWHAEHRCF